MLCYKTIRKIKLDISAACVFDLNIESVTSVMSQEVYNHLVMQRGGKYAWKSMINSDLKISDLDEQAIMGAVHGGIRSGRLPETRYIDYS